jgi:branched-chain amino acid transport system substrate-binding protein
VVFSVARYFLTVGDLVMFKMRDLLMAAVIGAASSVTPVRAEIVIAVAGPMTGERAWRGEQLSQGARVAVSNINAAGGVLGENVRLIVADDACDPEQAVAVARKLVADGVVFVDGHNCSSSSIPASKVYEEAGIIQISPASTNPKFTDEGGANVFRTCGRDDQQGIVAGNYLADHWGDKRIAILHDNSTYGKGLADRTRTQLNDRGVTEARYGAYAAGTVDYSELASSLKAAAIDVLYVGGYPSDAALIIREARDIDYALQLVSGDAMTTEEFWLAAGPAGEGSLFTFGPDPRQNPEAASVVEQFRAELFEPTGYTLNSYAAVQAWAQAVEMARSLDLEAVISSLRSNQFSTVLGTIQFDQTGGRHRPRIRLVCMDGRRIRAGEVKPVELPRS